MKKLQLLFIGCILFLTTTAQWTFVNSTAFTDQRSIEMISSTEGYIAGQQGIFKTLDGGATWGQVHYSQADSFNYTYISYYSVHYSNSLNGIAVGWASVQDNSIITKTTNGIWTTAYQGATGSKLYDVYFTNSNTGFAIGTGGIILKTTNAGTSWNMISSPTTSDLNRVRFDPSDPNMGLIAADGGMLRTTDGGQTWNVISSLALAGGFISVSYAAPGLVFASNGGNLIYTSTDGGANWLSLPNTLFSFNSLYFVSVDTGYATGDGIFKTTDGGHNWEQQQITSNAKYIYFYGSQAGFTVGLGGEIFRTTNAGGNLWKPIATLSVSGAYTCTDSLYHFSSSGYPYYTYRWFFNDQLLSTHVSDSALMTGTNTIDTIRVIVSNGVLSDTASLSFISHKNTAPHLALLRTNRDSLCSGQTVVFYIDSTVIGASYRLWQNGLAVLNPVQGTGYTINFTIPSITATSAFTLKATFYTSCGNFESTVSRIITVANPLDIPLAPLLSAICKHDTAIIVIPNSQMGVNYGLCAYNAGTLSVNGNGSTVYIVYPDVIQPINCFIYAVAYLNCQTILSDTVSISVRNLQVNFLSPADALVGQNVPLQNLSNGDRYWWTFDSSATVVNDTSFLPILSYNSTGLKRVSLESYTTEGCDDSIVRMVRVYEPTDSVTPGQVCYFDSIQLGDPAGNVIAYHIDKAGNHYVSGYTYYSYFGSNYSGSFHYYLQKFNPQGQLLWEKKSTPADYSAHSVNIQKFSGAYITGISTDPDGNVYVSGNYGAINFVFDNKVIRSTSTNPVSFFFAAKFDSSGVLKWIIHNTSYDNPTYYTGASDILYVDSSHVYLTVGGTSNIYSLSDPNDSSYSNSLGANFIMCMNANGWYQSSIAMPQISAIFNPSNAAYIMGWIGFAAPKMKLRKDGKIGVAGIIGSGTGYIGVYDPIAGWQSSFNPYSQSGTPSQYSYSSFTDRLQVFDFDDENNVYVRSQAREHNDVISFPGNGSFRDTSNSSYVARYSPTGQAIWVIHNNGGSIKGLAVSDNNAEVYLYNEYNPFGGVVTASSVYKGWWGDGLQDVSIVSFDSSGNFLWREKIAGDGSDGAFLLAKNCGGVLNLLGYVGDTARVKNSVLNINTSGNFLLKYDPTGFSCQQQVCPDCFASFSQTFYTVPTVDTILANQNVAVFDSVTVYSTFNALDTLHTFDTIIQLVNLHITDTSNYYSTLQTFDSLSGTCHSLNLDSVVYYDSSIVSLTWTYIDSGHIVRTIIATGMNHINDTFRLIIYPNPAGSFTELSYFLPSFCSVSIKVLDALGRESTIFADGQQVQGNHSLRIATDGLSNGVYQVVFKAGGKEISRQLILNK